MFQDIDWESQWAFHGHNFQNGFVHVDLRERASFQKWEVIKLKPGPGFGDLSHPTTRLVVWMLPRYVSKKLVVDIGCGSGVLSLCAVGCGAVFVEGVDIDPDAVLHASLNAKLNDMEHYTRFRSPESFQHFFHSEAVVLMNMIRSEQKVAWNSLKSLHSIPGISIVSGILSSERDLYVQQCQEWNWKLIDEQEEEGWLGMSWQRL